MSRGEALTDAQLQSYALLAKMLQMDALLEVHDADELRRALRADSPLVGINNRDLRTFGLDLRTTLALKPDVPEGRLLVTESGILARADVELMRGHGVHAFLVGEAMMRAEEPGEALRALFY